MRAQLVNEFGRPIDDIDMLRLRIAAKTLVGVDGYSIISRDGRPICGFVSSSTSTAHALTAAHWACQGKAL